MGDKVMDKVTDKVAESAKMSKLLTLGTRPAG
jgi:hypothetical protein